ncbi:hypothetical protein B7494_g5093 [Chlorociboria aeruginascens]|nr:hypothetical protein B7494_g5093 [Chlorociboria aeruginascens]
MATVTLNLQQPAEGRPLSPPLGSRVYGAIDLGSSLWLWRMKNMKSSEFSQPSDPVLVNTYGAAATLTLLSGFLDRMHRGRKVEIELFMELLRRAYWQYNTAKTQFGGDARRAGEVGDVIRKYDGAWGIVYPNGKSIYRGAKL